MSNTQSLLTILNTTNLQKSDNRLYQVLKNLIENLLKEEQTTTAIAAVISGGTGITQLTGDVTAGPGTGSVVATVLALASQVLSSADITAFFPNSRELLAGTNITFDDTVPNERTISSTGGGSSSDHVLMGDGATPPSPMTIGNQFMYVAYTP